MLCVKLSHTFNESKFQMNIDIALTCNGISVIVGPSGSGKTTLLRSIAGLLRADHGHVKFNEEVWQDNEFYIPAHQRSIAYVFQEGSLLPHLTAQQNIEYALKRSKTNQKYAEVNDVIDLLGIRQQLSQFPSQMSGGERQRIAIASAIIRGAKILLMDEPLAALDKDRKDKLLSFFKMIRSEYNLPIVYVTHSIEEAQYLANHIVVMRDGMVEKEGDCEEIISELNESIHLYLSSEDISKNSLNKSLETKLCMLVRRDQCLLFDQLPPHSIDSVAIKVKVESKENDFILLSYHGQRFKIVSKDNFEVGKALWLLCANPQIK